MSRKPFNFLRSQFVWKYQSMFFTYTFSTFWQFLHFLKIYQIFLHRSTHFQRNSESVMTHRSTSDRFRQSLMCSFICIELKNLSKFRYLCCPLLDKLIKIEISFVHPKYYINFVFKCWYYNHWRNCNIGEMPKPIKNNDFLKSVITIPASASVSS